MLPFKDMPLRPPLHSIVTQWRNMTRPYVSMMKYMILFYSKHKFQKQGTTLLPDDYSLRGAVLQRMFEVGVENLGCRGGEMFSPEYA